MTMPSVREIWEGAGARAKILWVLLLPAAFLYSLGVQARNFFYALGWLKSARLPKPVVSVGNLTVGGTGKTPTCLWLAEELQKQGLRVGILSRGYRRNETRPLVLQPQSRNGSGPGNFADVSRAGDEPSMMADLYGQVVGIGKKRDLAAAELLRSTDVDVFILDDGFQHLQLARTIDVLLVSPADLDERVLPSGRLREGLDAARVADALVVSGTSDEVARVSSALGVATAFRVETTFCALRPLGEGEAPVPPGARVVAVAGIARPERFFRAVRAQGWTVVAELRYSDHHWYSVKDLAEINNVAQEARARAVVTTEKDAVRVGEQAWWAALPMHVTIEPAAEFKAWLSGRLQ